MGALRVVGLDASIVTLPLRRTVRHASYARTTTDNIVVRCELNDGSIGWGEGVPREYVTGETADSAFELLKSNNWKSLAQGCADFAAAVRLAESFDLPPVPGDDRQCQTNAARCAVELAVLDAFCRSTGESLTTVTELIAPDLYSFRPKVQYSGAITSSKGWKLRALALGYRVLGFRHVKIKVGIAGVDDEKRLAIIRRCLGRKINVRIDANEAWSANNCLEKLQALAKFNLDCVEQPISHQQLSDLGAIRKKSPIPIMLDESLCSRIDAEHAVANQLCDRFNLRLSKCGGYISTLRLAQYAKQSGISYQLGCQVGESAILSGAGRHFACSVDGLTAIEGSFDRHLMKETLGYEDLTFGRGGWAKALGGCGHGAWVDVEAVEKHSRRTEKLL